MTPYSRLFGSFFFLGCIFLLQGGLSGLFAGEGRGEAVPAVTQSNFASEVLESPKTVLVDFWATWCGPCRIYGPIVGQVAQDYKGRLKVVKVNVDDNPVLSKSLGVHLIPTCFLFQKGKSVRRWVGVVSESDLKYGIDRALKAQEADR